MIQINKLKIHSTVMVRLKKLDAFLLLEEVIKNKCDTILQVLFFLQKL